MNPEVVSWYAKFPKAYLLHMIFAWFAGMMIINVSSKRIIDKRAYTILFPMVYPIHDPII